MGVVKEVEEGFSVAEVAVEGLCVGEEEKEAVVEGVFESVPEVVALSVCEGMLDSKVVEEEHCEGEREGAALAVGCTEAVETKLAEAVRVGLRVALALSGSSQQEALLLAPASE